MHNACELCGVAWDVCLPCTYMHCGTMAHDKHGTGVGGCTCGHHHWRAHSICSTWRAEEKLQGVDLNMAVAGLCLVQHELLAALASALSTSSLSGAMCSVCLEAGWEFCCGLRVLVSLLMRRMFVRVSVCLRAFLGGSQ